MLHTLPLHVWISGITTLTYATAVIEHLAISLSFSYSTKVEEERGARCGSANGGRNPTDNREDVRLGRRGHRRNQQARHHAWHQHGVSRDNNVNLGR